MDNDNAIAMMMIITMIMMIILISQWNCSDIRDLINQGRNCILSKEGGGGGLGVKSTVLTRLSVDIHSKSGTHFFACAVCEAGGICPHPILHWQVRWQEGPSILQNLVPNCNWRRKYFDKKGSFQRWFLRKNFDCLHIFVQKEWIFEINLGFG